MRGTLARRLIYATGIGGTALAAAIEYGGLDIGLSLRAVVLSSVGLIAVFHILARDER